MTKLSIKPWH